MRWGSVFLRAAVGAVATDARRDAVTGAVATDARRDAVIGVVATLCAP